MALAPISQISTTYDQYPNYWLKGYAQGTTTPISMATDSTGGTLLAKAEISAGGTVPIGFIKTAGDAIFIPYYSEAYDLFLFPTEAEADANDTSNAIQVADNMAFLIDLGNWVGVLTTFATIASAVASTELSEGAVIRIADRGNSVWDVVLSSSVTENTFNIVQCTGVATLSLTLRLERGIKSNEWGTYTNRTTDFTAPVQAMIDYAMPLGLNIEITDACLVTTLNIDKVVDGNTASATVPGDAIVDVNNNDTYFRIFGEGRLLKSDTGNMFDTNLTNVTATSPVVQMVEIAVDIEHTDPSVLAYLISPKYLRTKFVGKTIDGMKFVKSTTILSQSIYLQGPVNIRRVQGKFWDNDSFNYDIQIHCLMEASADGFWMKNAIGCTFRGIIEGLSGTAIAYDGAEGLDISGMYFEQNYLDIDGTYGGVSTSVGNGVHLVGSYLAKTPTTPNAATQANPVVITTTAAHGYRNGDKVYIVSVGGMTEINGLVFTVANVASTTFELSGIDGTSYTAFTADGNGRIHPFTVKWGKTVRCVSLANRHTGAFHDITDPTVDDLITYDQHAAKLSTEDDTKILSAGYDETYTGTLTGCTTSPTGTIRANKTGNIVTLYIPSIKATSNTTACTITGMTSDLYPARQQIVTGRVMDNTTEQFGVVIVGTGGILTLATGAGAGAFTGSGTKGAEVQTISYSIT